MEFGGFEWDHGNRDKSRLKHGILPEEAEQCFFNDPWIVVDEKHSTEEEKRYILLGETDAKRRLFIAFTMRGVLVRVISARPMHWKEERYYEEEKKKASL
ncbi:MAG: BrnT family toxin [Deltaproteobacteria bacterium]|nr:BrnT family toxin [Deltaproteobacteria bacterium]